MLSYKITVFGAGGKTGRLVVARLLSEGCEVVAFVHNTNPFSHNPRLSVMHGDIHNYSQVARAVRGSDAVISTLGSWGTPKKNVLTSGMRNIIPAMEQHGVHRIVSLTGAEARASRDSYGNIHKVMHILLGLGAGKVLRDSEKHISLLEHSTLDWTVLRSPIMWKGRSDRYDLTIIRPQPWAVINRAAVVRSLIELAKSSDYCRSAPYIKR